MNRKNLSWILLPIFVFALLLSGCGAARAAAQMTELQQKADHAVVIVDAYTIASSINVYNAMLDAGSNDTITSISSVEDLKKKLGTLWPDKMTDDDAKKALPLITIVNGVADVKKESAQPAS